MKRAHRGSAVRRLVLDLPAASADSQALVVGPQHPLMRGAARLVLEAEGEAIVAVDVQVGLVHRGFEKEAEATPVEGVFPLVERLNYLSPLLNAVGFALALERLLDVEAQVPERARLLRVIVSELSRIGDHLTCLGMTVLSLGVSNAFFVLMDLRARLWQLLEAATGPRLGPSYVCAGGLARDVPGDWPPAVRRFGVELRRALKQIRILVDESPTFRERTVGVAVIDASQVGPWGLSGPVARASGVALDVRKDAPYLGYDAFDFEVPLGSAGDNWDRYAVRLEEVRQSLRIVEQAIARLRPGAVCAPALSLDHGEPASPSASHVWRHARLSGGLTLPAREVYRAVEGANGELGFHLVSKGGPRLAKCRVRAPSFLHAAMLARVLPGHHVADVVPTFALLNIVGGECDR